MEEPDTKNNVSDDGNSKYEGESNRCSDTFKLNAVTLSSANLILYNSLDNDLYSLLKLALGKLSRSSSVNLYSTQVLVDKASLNRFNEVFIDNPDLYFTEFTTAKSNQKQLVITSKYTLPAPGDTNVIIATTNSRIARDTYNDFSSNQIPVVLLYKRDTCMTFQCKFYKNILSKISKIKNQKLMYMLNNENEAAEIVAVYNSNVYFF